MKKLYISGNYIIADFGTGTVTEYPMNKCSYTLEDGYYKVKEEIYDGEFTVLIAEIGTWFDETGAIAYTEGSLVTFLRANTGFNPASGGSEAEYIYHEQIISAGEIRTLGSLPITILAGIANSRFIIRDFAIEFTSIGEPFLAFGETLNFGGYLQLLAPLIENFSANWIENNAFKNEVGTDAVTGFNQPIMLFNVGEANPAGDGTGFFTLKFWYKTNIKGAL